MVLNVSYEIILDQMIDELRGNSFTRTKDRFTFETILTNNLGIYTINDTDNNTNIFIYGDGDVVLEINKDTKISDVLNDPEKYIKEVENPQFFDYNKSGKFAPFLDYKINGNKKFKIELGEK